jgi:hypothetical protein
VPDGLTPSAEAVFELLNGVSSEHADRLIDALGASFVGALEAASPSDQLENLRAETLIMHSLGDALIPVEESRGLAEALTGRVPLHYAEFTLFDHVDISRSLPAATLLREVLRLINHTRLLMRFAIASRPAPGREPNDARTPHLRFLRPLARLFRAHAHW